MARTTPIIQGNMLTWHADVDNPNRSAQIVAALAAQGITHDAIRLIEVRMEEAFISLVRQQKIGRANRWG